jgi:GDP-D-mannose 3', 5'-epimerase
MHCDRLIATPINLGTSELVSINQLVDISKRLAGSRWSASTCWMRRGGVAGRNSDNTLIKAVLDWEPNLPLQEGLKHTYHWIEQQYADRKAGKRVVQD